MSLISLHDATFDFGRKKILDRVSLALLPGVKYALVGANGAGKTTLLAALAGDLEISSSNRQVAGSVTSKLLRQETELTADQHGDQPLIDIVATIAFARERSLEGELAELATRLAVAGTEDQTDLIARQGKLQTEFERLDGYTIQHRLETALRGVGLPRETWHRSVTQLSGGERRRAALAIVLLSGADVLLMDEPTNHLDLASCEWLEGFLEQYAGTVVLVSHDRFFLDRIATRTLHLERGRLNSYTGNYSFFTEASRARYQLDLATWERQQIKIRQTEEYIRRNIEGQKTKQAQSRRKQLAKIARLEKPPSPRREFRFDLKPARPSGSTVLETRKLGKAYGGRTLFSELDFLLAKGERVGIIGHNGCGKSTLLKVLAGIATYEQGVVIQGHNVDIGLYDQDLLSVADHHTVMGEIAAVEPNATVGELRSFLAAFGFGEGMIDLSVAELSGGERSRLALLRLIKERHNTLLLDEPTNHLDVSSRESLEQALQAYSGTLLVVSHDRRFLDKVVDRLLIFSPPDEQNMTGEIVQFPGNYSGYVRDRNEKKQAAAQARANRVNRSTGTSRQDACPPANERADVSGNKRPLSKNEKARRQNLIVAAEQEIERLEAEKETILAEMSKMSISAETLLEHGNRCAEIDTQIAQQMEQWEQLSLEIEEGM